MRCGRRRGARLSNLSSYHFGCSKQPGPISGRRRNDMNDKNEQSQSQGQEVPPDPFPELDSFILGLTPEKLKDTSLEDNEREENLRFADQLHATVLPPGEKTAIELERRGRWKIFYNRHCLLSAIFRWL